MSFVDAVLLTISAGDAAFQKLLGKHADWALPCVDAMGFGDPVLLTTSAGEEPGAWCLVVSVTHSICALIWRYFS